LGKRFYRRSIGFYENPEKSGNAILPREPACCTPMGEDTVSLEKKAKKGVKGGEEKKRKGEVFHSDPNSIPLYIECLES
jgi:hypothetical protein